MSTYDKGVDLTVNNAPKNNEKSGKNYNKELLNEDTSSESKRHLSDIKFGIGKIVRPAIQQFWRNISKTSTVMNSRKKMNILNITETNCVMRREILLETEH